MHDYDLMMLKSKTNINLSKVTKAVLESYLQNKQYKLNVSELKIKENVPGKTLPYHSTYVIQLHEEKDKEIIDLLSKIEPGYANCFVRTLLRHYLSFDVLSWFLEQDSDKNAYCKKQSLTESVVTPFMKGAPKKRTIEQILGISNKEENSEKIVKNNEVIKQDKQDKQDTVKETPARTIINEELQELKTEFKKEEKIVESTSDKKESSNFFISDDVEEETNNNSNQDAMSFFDGLMF